MKRRKTLWTLLLSFIIALSLGIFAACSNSKEDKEEGLAATVKTLTATSEEVLLGGVYETASSFTEGETSYAVTHTFVYKVKDGSRVYAIEGEFDVLEVLGYEIEYHSVQEDIDYVKKHTLTVKDGGKPVISVTPKRVANVGEKYEYPTITVRDDSGAELNESVSVKWIADESKEVAFDANGFTPTEVGFYRLYISAKDAAGNEGTATYDVYARTALAANEIDSFEDVGLQFTAYTKSGSAQGEVGFATFARTAGAKGSAYFAAAGQSTGFYFQPRKAATVMDEYGDDACLSVWLYLASSVTEDKTVKFGPSGSQTVKTNVWTEVKIDGDAVGQYARYFSGLSTGNAPLFEIVNDGSDYIAFVDSVTVSDGGALSVSGLQDTYNVGDNVTFSTEASVTAEYIYAGKSYPVTNKTFKAESAGTYTVNVYTENGVRNYTKQITVGNLTAEFTETPWFIAGKSVPAPAYVLKKNGSAVEADSVKIYQLDLAAGTEKEVTSLTVPSEGVVGIRMELTYDAEKISIFSLSTAHPYGKDVWFVLDNPDAIETFNNTTEFSYEYLEEYDGEEGVVAIHGVNQKTDENSWYYFNNRASWAPLYSKSHYAEYEKLVFKVKASDRGILFGLIGEDTNAAWVDGVLSISNDLETGWTEYSLDMQTIVNHFDDYANRSMFLMKSGVKSNYTVYIADVRLVDIPPRVVPENTWIDVDDPLNVVANDPYFTYHETFDGQEGVIEIKTANDVARINRAMFGIYFDEAHYDEYDTLVFKMKASQEGINVAYGSETPWEFVGISSNVATEWTTYKISLDSLPSNFDALDTTNTFYFTGPTASLYIDAIYVEKLPAHTTPQNAWIDTDAPVHGTHNTDRSIWHQTYDGQTGVIELKKTDLAEGGNTNRAVFGPAFEKAHYEGKGYTKLVFKAKASVAGINLAYGSETPWSFVSISGNVATTWTEYEVDLATVLANYDGIAASNMFYLAGNVIGSVYLADVYVK